MNNFSVFVCDAQPIVVEGFSRVLEATLDLRLLGAAGEAPFALQEIGMRQPDIVILGHLEPTRSTLVILPQVREVSANSKVILWVNEFNEMESFRALQLGARGVLFRRRSVPTLLECLRSVADGNVWVEAPVLTGSVTPVRAGLIRITPREREIIAHIGRGMKNKEIAEALSITPGTVKVHLMHIYEKLGVKDRFQLAIRARQIQGVDEFVAAGNGTHASAEL